MEARSEDEAAHGRARPGAATGDPTGAAGRRLGVLSARTRLDVSQDGEGGNGRRRLGAQTARRPVPGRRERPAASFVTDAWVGVVAGDGPSPGDGSGTPRLVAGRPLAGIAGTAARRWPGATWDPEGLRRAARARPGLLLWWGTVAAVSVAELVTAYADPRAGTLAHLVILLALLGGAAFAPASRLRQALLTLTLAPLIRIVSLAAPLAALPQLSWFLLTAAPLLATAALIARECGWRPAEIGLGLSPRPLWLLEAAVIASGLALGAMEYAILRPAPLPVPPGVMGIVVAALVLWVGTGVLEEVLFRGLLQRAAEGMLPSMGAILVVSALFAALHIGYKSLLDFAFVFAVAVYFALVVRRTRSIWGVSVAHGLTNTMLFVLLPRADLSWALVGTLAGHLSRLFR